MQLTVELMTALSTMDLKKDIPNIRKEIAELQDMCPHKNSMMDFSHEEECPYCGRRFKG